VVLGNSIATPKMQSYGLMCHHTVTSIRIRPSGTSRTAATLPTPFIMLSGAKMTLVGSRPTTSSPHIRSRWVAGARGCNIKTNNGAALLLGIHGVQFTLACPGANESTRTSIRSSSYTARPTARRANDRFQARGLPTDYLLVGRQAAGLAPAPPPRHRRTTATRWTRSART